MNFNMPRIFQKLFFLIMVLLVFPINARGARVEEIGAGWENIGIYSGSTNSRREASVVIGSRDLGISRFYYSTFTRMQYGYDWAPSGQMNLLEVNLGLLGLGVYLSNPLSAYSESGRIGEWFVTVDINVGSISFGGNLTPSSGGEYAYFQYSIPVRLQFFNMVTRFIGVGFFIESNVCIIEKSLNMNLPVSIGYNVQAGFIMIPGYGWN